MRFEAKNSYFKWLASSIGNYINVPYTLAFRQQSLSCYNNLDTSTFVNERMEVVGGKYDYCEGKWVHIDIMIKLENMDSAGA